MSEGLRFSLRLTPHSGWVFTSTKALCNQPPTGSNRPWLSFLGLAWVIYSPSHCPLLLLEERGHIHCPSWGHRRAPGLQLPPHWALASCLRGMQRQARGGLEEAWGQGSELSTSWPVSLPWERALVLSVLCTWCSVTQRLFSGESLQMLWSGTCSCHSISSGPHSQEPAAFPRSK